MLKVEVDGYFVGRARDLSHAEHLVIEHVEWMDAQGKFDIALAIGRPVVMPFRFLAGGVVMYDGQVDLSTIRKPVKGAVGGVADPLRPQSE